MDVFRRSFISGFVQFRSKNMKEQAELAEVGVNGKKILKFVFKKKCLFLFFGGGGCVSVDEVQLVLDMVRRRASMNVALNYRDKC